jgi:hypothetical protein
MRRRSMMNRTVNKTRSTTLNERLNRALNRSVDKTASKTMNKKLTKRMKKRIGAAGLRTVRRHPRAVLRALLFASRHRKGVAGIARAGWTVRRRARGAAQIATNPKARTETQLAAAELARAVRRVRSLGLARALEDKRIASQLQHVSRHASNAVAVGRPRRRRPLARAAVIAGAGGAVSGALYAGRRVFSPPTRDGG